ncbi:MAG TPA: O-antigen ligase family protein [Trueperaceae bacterium]
MIDVPELPDSADGPLRLRASLGLQEGVELQMRNVELVPGDGSSIEPVQSITRRSLWFSYPNLAGHVLLLVALTLVSLTPSIRLGLLIAVIAMGGVASTQSATALVAGLVGLPLLLVLKVKGASPKRILLIAIPVLYLLGFAGAVVFAPQLVESVLESPGLTRVQIWRTAWKGFLAHPLTGVGFGGEEFSDYFASAYPRNLPDAIPNAHNLWLTHASELGVAGLLASLWLTGGLLILGWNWGRWHGIAFLLPVFILNTLDYSFFSWWILFLVILGLNLMRGSAEPQPHIQR